MAWFLLFRLIGLVEKFRSEDHGVGGIIGIGKSFEHVIPEEITDIGKPPDKATEEGKLEVLEIYETWDTFHAQKTSTKVIGAMRLQVFLHLVESLGQQNYILQEGPAQATKPYLPPLFSRVSGAGWWSTTCRPLTWTTSRRRSRAGRLAILKVNACLIWF